MRSPNRCVLNVAFEALHFKKQESCINFYVTSRNLSCTGKQSDSVEEHLATLYVDGERAEEHDEKALSVPIIAVSTLSSTAAQCLL